LQHEIPINLGIDFGTRFTKICIRSDEVGTAVVDYDGFGLDGALLPSVVILDEQQNLSIPNPGVTPPYKRSIAYLKMALADRGSIGVGSEVNFPFSPTADIIKGLSAFFLAHTIDLAKQWALVAWKDHIGTRGVQWSANVGLPVEYVDSDVMPGFQEAIAAAWSWSESAIPAGTVDDIVRAYLSSSARETPDMSYCQTYPEIAAAVMSFATSRSAAPGTYVYFDIGGGTVDGVIFNLRRHMGEVGIDFYSGHVASAGVDWVADEIRQRMEENEDYSCELETIKRILLHNDSEKVDKAFRCYAITVSGLAGRVVYEGKRKDLRNWRQKNIQEFGASRRLRNIWSDENVDPLKVFVGGGGSGSPFYQKAVAAAYDRLTLRNYGIPPFDLVQVPPPPDILMGSVDSEEYHRFLIAYGLSMPFGEGPDFRLPSQFENVERPVAVRAAYIPNYADLKDIFD